jgi:hypothetical protein
MKIDFRKEYKDLYTASATRPVIVDVPELSFLMVDGVGDPNTSPDYQGAVEALYGLSYWLKFAVKKGEGGVDYAVMPLEGLWWTEDMAKFSPDRKDIWQWTAMIMQPEYVTPSLFQEALTQVAKKKNPPLLSKVRFSRFHEELGAQVMFIGPYAAEGPTIEMLHGFINTQGRRLRGKHHEIYLGDPRRSAPEKLKTIIRQPVS